MPQHDLTVALRHLCHSAGLSPTSDLTDRQLLDRFAADRDEAAFAALVRRHGAAVFGACRRVLQNDADAEDAFQATFLVLARQPRSVRSGRSVGPWLYGVALRLASRLRADAHRRRYVERDAGERPALEQPDPTLREVEAALDEELTALPDRLRAPLVLCYLEARTQDEAAREMGWSARTLRRRLAEGRRRLHLRLVRRGLSLPAALWTVGIVRHEASAHLPYLAKSVSRAAAAFTAKGGSLPAGSSPRAERVARACLRGMAVNRFSAVAALTLVLGGLVGAGFTVMLSEHPPARAVEVASGEESRAPDAGRPDAAAPGGDALPAGAVARLGSNLLRVGDGSVAVAPDGKTLVALSPGGVVYTLDAASGRELARRTLGDRDRMFMPGYGSCLSDDGSTVALMENNISGGGLTVWDVRTGRRILRLEEVTGCALSPDGKSLAVTQCVDHVKCVFRVYDVASGRSRDVAVPPGAYSNDFRFTPDGKRIINRCPVDGDRWGVAAYDVAGGGQLWQVAPANAFGLSADGRTVFVCELSTANRLRGVDVETGKPVKGIKLPEHYAVISRPVGLPDGRGLLVPLAPADLAVWDCQEGRELRRLRTSSANRVSSVAAVAGDGKSVYVLSDGLRGWRIDTGEVLLRPPAEVGHSYGVTAITFLPGGKELASIDRAGTLVRWSLATGRPVGEPLRRAGAEARVTSAGLLAATVTRSSLAIRGVSARELAGRVTFPGDRSPREWNMYWQFGLLADGRTVLTYYPRPDKAVVAASDFAAGKTLYEVDVPPPPSTFTTFQGFSPCGRRFAAYGGVYSARSGKKLWTPTVEGRDEELGTLQPATFSADGRLLCGALQIKGQPGTRGGFAVWETASASVVIRSDFPFNRGFAIGPDGRTLAQLTGRGIRFVDLSTGTIAAEYDAPDVADTKWLGFRTHNVVFSPDGKNLATGQYDGTVLLWKVPELPAAKLTAADWPGAWADLAGSDAARAVYAADRMAREPAATVAFLTAKYRARPGVDVAALIHDLDSPEFARREAASGKLREVGFQAEAAMRDALKTASPEVRRRLSDLLDDFGATSEALAHGEGLRALRVIAILERVGTAEAVTLLREWAGRAPDSPLRAEARLALERLSLR
jgi:RNA polymerase sigma factor (sigma-70 family)